MPVPELWDRVADLAATAPSRPRRERRRLTVALAAAAVVLIAVGAPLLLIASRDSAEVTGPAESVVSLEWSRIPHDDAIFGGEGGAEMLSIAAGGPGFVAVGTTGDGVGEGSGLGTPRYGPLPTVSPGRGSATMLQCSGAMVTRRW